MNIAGRIPLILGALWASAAMAHGPDGHEAESAQPAEGSATFLSWELQQATVNDARSAQKMADALQGMSGPQAALHATYGVCLARMVGVIGDDIQTHLLHEPGQTASYVAGEQVGSKRAVDVSFGWADVDGATAEWSIRWKPEGDAEVVREGRVDAHRAEHLHIPMAEVDGGTLLLATVGLRTRSRMFNPPYETAKAMSKATEDCAAVALESNGKQKKAFKDWLKQVTSAD